MTATTMPPPVPGRAPPPRGWLSRNGTWLVPSLLVAGVAAVAAFVFLLFSLVAGSMRGTDAYRQAVAITAADAIVQSRLGQPIEPGRFIMGSLQESGGSGSADLAIPVHGPKGEATVHVEASKSAGEWRLDTLVVAFDDGTGKRRDLLVDRPRPE
jgi:Cytochrome oxidase complex assembly protein 1